MSRVGSKPKTTLTGQELEIMKVIWKLETATVRDVYEHLRARRTIAYTTVLTMMKILEQKGYVKKTREERAFVYRPAVDERQARQRALRHLVTRLFNGSPSLLIVNVLEDEAIDPSELKRLKKLIEDA